MRVGGSVSAYRQTQYRQSGVLKEYWVRSPYTYQV